ncbi:MAG TPA: bifunctional 5,10-methylenetetrahydrofolate dehydrogenase/5,10-methenyltetrahydrofolate cyclohydrolase [Phycisphaerae bacterium]|nr:bifunctional 5,10-methylenetetrahydrofolate dehydrogenase/5,10-methenyltetrahydrofolate cyclohydrolase [Phycisphaerae bacterium]
MPAKLIDGEALAARIKADLAKDIAAIKAKTGAPPRLASVLASDNPGAKVYTRSQAKSCEEAGIAYDLVELPPDSTAAALAAKIDALGRDAAVHGILLQMPLPQGVNARDLAERIPASKDVEGITAANLGRLLFYEGAELVPCTAAAAYELIKFAGCTIKGAECVVVGHSPIVGKPVACLIVNDLGTCTVCHIGTRDLKAHTTKAEILVVAAGKAGLVRGEHIRPGATVIDVGINRVPVLDDKGQPVVDEKGKKKMKTVGDVEFESAVKVAGAITPVPGGVGPVTVAILLRNTVRAALARGR